MSSADNIERSIAELNLTTRAETDRRILDDASAALDKAVHKQQQMVGIGIWSMIKRSRFAVPVAIAAMILLAFSLFINFRTDVAINAETIYRALSDVENVHITTYRAGQTSPDRQVWTSESLGVKLLKTGFGNQAQYTLWDTKNRVRMIKFLSSDSVQTEPITEQMLTELERATVDSNDIFPPFDRSNILEGAQWNRIEDHEISSDVSGTKAYDLNWIIKNADSQTVLYRKWRVFADNRTSLPKRIEWYSKTGTEDEYGFEKFAVIAYPSEDEIQKIIRDVFGWRNDPGFIGTPEAYR
jgi:hypothetical protein